MFTTPAQFAELQKGQMDAAVALSQPFFDAAERLMELNLAAAKATLEETVEKTQALLSVKDAQELFALSTGNAQPTLEKAVSYSRTVSGIANGANAEVSRIIEAQIAESNKDDPSTSNRRPDDGVSKSPLVLIETAAMNPWCSRLATGGRFNLYNALLCCTLAKKIIPRSLSEYFLIVRNLRPTTSALEAVAFPAERCLAELLVGDESVSPPLGGLGAPVPV